MRSRLMVAVGVCAAVLATAGCGGNEASADAPASWSLHHPGTPVAEDSAVGPSTREFTAFVTRTGCSGGFTGEVLAPKIQNSATEVVVTFRVPAIELGDYSCPGNPAVPYKVVLTEPLGGRKLVDGRCTDAKVADYAYCRTPHGPGVRYSPPAK